MNGDLYTPAELEALTKRKRPTAQVRVLNGLGIPHRVHPDGVVLVHRAVVADLLGACPTSRVPLNTGPKWDAM